MKRKSRILCLLIIAMLTFSMSAEVTVLPVAAKTTASKKTKKSKKNKKKSTKKTNKTNKATKKAKKKAAKAAAADTVSASANAETTAAPQAVETAAPAAAPIAEAPAAPVPTAAVPAAEPVVSSVESAAAAPQAVAPQPTAPQTVTPQAVAPQPTAPQTVATQVATPQPTAPKAETKVVSEAPKTESQPTVTEPTAPKAEEPQPTVTESAAPKVEESESEPQTTAPKAEEPESEPQSTIPAPAPEEPKACEHVYDWVVTVEPGCTTVGYKIQRCTICGETKGSQKIVDPVGHDLQTVEALTVPGTCQKAGKITEECTRCGARYTKSTGYGSHVYENDSPCVGGQCIVCGREKIVGKQGHSYSERIVKEATCSEAGMVEEYCVRCGETSTREIPATGYHSYDGWTTTKAATCEEEGLEKATCTVCGEEKTRTVAHLSHTYATRVTKTPTCEETGTEETYCTVCKKVLSTREIPTTGHKLGRRCAIYSCDGGDNCGHVDICVYCGATYEDGTWTHKDH